MNGHGRQFDQRSFLVLPENRLAVAAVKKLAPGLKRRAVRLVTLVGPAGCGKSHLVRELMRSWERERTDGKLVLTTASQFAAQLAEASSTKSIFQFQARHRNDVVLLVCEDLQALEGRGETQQQLVAALDDVIAHGGLVLLTSTRMPGEIRGLSRRLTNRIHGGLCVPMELPGPEGRRKLIDQLLQGTMLKLSGSQVRELAENSRMSPRELTGLIARLQTEARLPPNAGTSTGSGSWELEAIPPAVDLADISRITAQAFGVTIADLKGPRRSQTLSRARHTAMYLARELAHRNFADIGAYFNRGNHSTVIHACTRIAADRERDPVLDHQIRTIVENLRGRQA